MAGCGLKKPVSPIETQGIERRIFWGCRDPREAEAKKKQVTVQLKEIQFRPNIETHDLETKLKRAEKFIGQGDKVKMVMQFRGREMAYKDQGLDKFKSIISNVEELGAVVESPMKMMGNRAITILAPSKKAPKNPKTTH